MAQGNADREADVSFRLSNATITSLAHMEGRLDDCRDQVWSRLMVFFRSLTKRLAGHLLEEAFQVHTPHGVLQLADRLGFDLPHTLARDLEDAADLFERVRVAILQAVAKADDLALAPGERLQQAFDFLPQD